MMEELFHRDPSGSLRFLNGLMHAGFIHGAISVCLMSYALHRTWDSKVSCDRPLTAWLLLQLALQCMQFVSRWQLYASLPPAPQLALLEDNAIRAEQSRRIIGSLSTLVASKRWTVNRMFGLVALLGFLLGTLWVFQARSCSTPTLWNICAVLLWLFCTRTAFVYMWFGYCFSGQAMFNDYSGPFGRPGVPQAALDAMGVSKVCEEDIAGKDLNCAICLADFEIGEDIRKMGCSHFFHTGCIDEWLIMSSTCPMCNDDVREPRSKQIKSN